MKLLLLSSFLSFFILSCQGQTEYGNCIGILEIKDPKLIYRPSVQNIIVSSITIEMIFPPIVVLVSEFYCPVRKK